jgi:hypothetical protein
MKLIHAAFIPLMFAHWAGWQISLVYVLLLMVVLLVVKLSQGQLYLHKVIVGILLFSVFFVVVNSFHIVDGANTDLVCSNLYQYLSLFVVVAILLFSRPWKIIEIHRIACMLFWVAFSSIAIEFIVVNFFGVSKEIMPAVRYSPAYFGDFFGWHRPFGLTGQSSANGGILLLSFLLLAEFKIADAKAVMALLAGTAFTISGQAILSTILILGFLQLSRVSSRRIKLVLVSSFLLIVFLILRLNLFQKLSLDYLIYVLWEKAYFFETLGVLNSWQLFFGTLGFVLPEGGRGTEVFMIESIRLFGLVFTILFWAFVWFLVKRARLKFFWFAASVVASVHYPTVFYIEAQLPLAFLYLSALPHPTIPRCDLQRDSSESYWGGSVSAVLGSFWKPT